MIVKIIGSGSMWNAYNSASYMIDKDILIDVPNGMCKYLFKMDINPMEINNVLITHFHGDHYFDMPFLMLLKSRCYKPYMNIICGYEGKKKIKKILKLAFPNSVKNIYKCLKVNYNFEEDFKINEYKVQKILMEHGKMYPSYGYIFSLKEGKVGFTGDTTYCPNLELMAQKCSYLFLDCMFIKASKQHMGIDLLKGLVTKYPTCKFICSHMEDITREELKRIKLNNVIIPDDGDIIDTKIK